VRRQTVAAGATLVGPGTDLRIGLLPTAPWEPPTNVNVNDIEHAWNLPSEEVYTVPDPGTSCASSSPATAA
jgi:leucyl aminopeptidase (aminopeptidase T)